MNNICQCGDNLYKSIFAGGQNRPSVVKCETCGLVRTFPFPKEQEKEKNYFVDQEDCEYRVKNLKDWHRFSVEIIDLVKKYKKTGVWLDVGTNIGVLVNDAFLSGFDAYGTDIAKEGIEYGKKLFNLNDRLFYEDLKEAKFVNKFDIVSYCHVLEHIRNLDQELKAINLNMENDGILVISVPSFNSIWRRVLGNRWRGLSLDQHYWQFEEKTLKTILKQNGFTVIKSILNKNIDYQIDFSLEGAVKALLTIISRFLYLGDNLIIISRK